MIPVWQRLEEVGAKRPAKRTRYGPPEGGTVFAYKPTILSALLVQVWELRCSAGYRIGCGIENGKQLALIERGEIASTGPTLCDGPVTSQDLHLPTEVVGR